MAAVILGGISLDTSPAPFVALAGVELNSFTSTPQAPGPMVLIGGMELNTYTAAQVPTARVSIGGLELNTFTSQEPVSGPLYYRRVGGVWKPQVFTRL